MRAERAVSIALTLVSLALPALAHDYVPRPPQQTPVLLKGGNVYTVSGDVMVATDVLFEKGKITALGTNLDLSAGTQIVDVTGKNVYPGLIAPATQIGLREIDAVRATRDDSEVGPITPEVLAHVAYNPDSEVIPTIRSNGIAVAQIAPVGSLLRGRSMITNLDGWTKEDAGIRLVDGVWLAWPSESLNAPANSKETTKRLEKLEEQRARLTKSFADARAYMARRSVDHGTPTDLRWEALIPVLEKTENLYVAANDYRQILEAIRFAREQDVKMVLVGGRESARAAAQLHDAGIPVILGEVTNLPMRQDDGYDEAYHTPAALEDASVKFCLSVNGSWEPRNLPLEAGQAVAFGLTKERALRAITLSAAEILGIDGELGSIEVGKRATIVVSDGDIMDTLGHRVTHMWIDGREVDLDNKQKELWRKYQQKP